MPAGPLVAIVDDDKSIRNATQNLLTAAGFSTAALKTPRVFSARRVATKRPAWLPTCECPA
jgi:FixJ family two-component response regulator